METIADPSALADLVAELDASDDVEHSDVAVADDAGWTLSAYPSGLVVWENVEEGGPRHLAGVSREQVVTLFRYVAGDLASVEAQPWQSGYGV